MTMKVVIITGSNSKISSSTRLAKHVGSILEENNHQVKLFDLYQSPLPYFSTDDAYSTHVALRELKQSMEQASAVVLSSPEYHGSISGVLKNVLDHLGQVHFEGKPVLSLSSAGGPVGVSSLQQLQSIVRNLHGINCPEWISIGGAERESFQQSARSDAVIDKKADARIHRATESFMRLAQLVHQNSMVV